MEIVGEAKIGVCVVGRSLGCAGGGSHCCLQNYSEVFWLPWERWGVKV